MSHFFSPIQTELLLFRAGNKICSGAFAQASSLLDQAQEKCPSHKGIALLRAKLFLYKRDLESAELLLNSLPADPPNPVVLLYFGQIYCDRGEFLKAKHYLLQCKERSPENLLAKNYLALCELHLGDKLSALKEIKKDGIQGGPVFASRLAIEMVKILKNLPPEEISRYEQEPSAFHTQPSEYADEGDASHTQPSEYADEGDASHTQPSEYADEGDASHTQPSEYEDEGDASHTQPSEYEDEGDASFAEHSTYDVRGGTTTRLIHPKNSDENAETTVMSQADRTAEPEPAAITQEMIDTHSEKSFSECGMERLSAYEKDGEGRQIQDLTLEGKLAVRLVALENKFQALTEKVEKLQARIDGKNILQSEETVKPFHLTDALVGMGYYMWGQHSLAKERFDMASGQLLRARTLYPSLSRIDFLCGEALVYAEKSEQALDFLEKARKTDGDVPELLYSLGRTYQNLGAFDKAEECYLKSLEKFSKSPEIYCALGEMETLKGNYGKAIDFFTKGTGGDYFYINHLLDETIAFLSVDTDSENG